MRKIENPDWRDDPQLQNLNEILKKTGNSLEEIFGAFPHAQEKILVRISAELKNNLDPDTLAEKIREHFERAREQKNSDFFKNLAQAIDGGNQDEVFKLLLAERLQRKSDREDVVAVNTDEERERLKKQDREGSK